jgi:hypothetical protein
VKELAAFSGIGNSVETAEQPVIGAARAVNFDGQRVGLKFFGADNPGGEIAAVERARRTRLIQGNVLVIEIFRRAHEAMMDESGDYVMSEESFNNRGV